MFIRYCAAAWLALCTARQWFSITNPYVNGTLAGCAAGLAVQIEKKGRRVELAL